MHLGMGCGAPGVWDAGRPGQTSHCEYGRPPGSEQRQTATVLKNELRKHHSSFP